MSVELPWLVSSGEPDGFSNVLVTGKETHVEPQLFHLQLI